MAASSLGLIAPSGSTLVKPTSVINRLVGSFAGLVHVAAAWQGVTRSAVSQRLKKGGPRRGTEYKVMDLYFR